MDAMYRSPILGWAMQLLYSTQPWARAMRLSIQKDPRWDLDGPFEDSYISLPPVALVAFIATTVSPTMTLLLRC